MRHDTLVHAEQCVFCEAASLAKGFMPEPSEEQAGILAGDAVLLKKPCPV
jgi:hypothetical protein